MFSCEMPVTKACFIFAAGPLQDPPLPGVRGQLPHHHHRQDTEVCNEADPGGEDEQTEDDLR